MSLPEPERMPTFDYANARRWQVMVYQPHSDDPLAGQTAREQATAMLREQIRAEGFQIIMDSVSVIATQAVVVAPDGDWEAVEARSPLQTGVIATWSAAASGTHTDAAEPTLVASNVHGGVHTFPVPDVVTRDGGGVRVRHDLGVPVTCWAHQPSGDRMGYLLAMVLDDNTEHLDLLPGVAFITVRADDHPDLATSDTSETGDTGAGQ